MPFAAAADWTDRSLTGRPSSLTFRSPGATWPRAVGNVSTYARSGKERRARLDDLDPRRRRRRPRRPARRRTPRARRRLPGRSSGAPHRRRSATFARGGPVREDPGGQLDAALLELVEEHRAQPGRLEAPVDRAVRRERLDLELEDVLQGDHVGLHALDLGDRRAAPRPVLEPLDVADHVERRGDLLADRLDRQVVARHQHHRLETGERVARGVGVHRRQRAVVARVHGLEHVERLRAADLADDDPVGAHAQRVAHEVADRRLRPRPRCSAGAPRAGARGAG